MSPVSQDENQRGKGIKSADDSYQLTPKVNGRLDPYSIHLEIYRQEIVEAQRIVAWIALRELGYCEADMACYLGVTTSCIYRSVSHGKRPKITVYIKSFCTFCTNVLYCTTLKA
jgi:hypothetical protein